MSELRSRRVGSVRPSQLMYTYGVGSMIDLPSVAVIVGGLDEWETANSTELVETRLLRAVREALGPQVARMLTPPWLPDDGNVNADWARIGIPVLPFPRWMRCPRCGLLTQSIASDGSGLFNLEVPVGKPDRARFVHSNCSGAKAPPTVIPARFVVACTDGHLDEFPWIEYCHARTGGTCPAGGGPLRITDQGKGTRSTDLLVRCGACNATMHMANAFNEARSKTMPTCRGREAHLRRFKPGGCKLQVRPLLLGASNAWFPLTLSALSIPAAPDPLGNLLATLLEQLAPVNSRDDLDPALKYNPALGGLLAYSGDLVWSRLCELRSGGLGPVHAAGLLRPEYDVLTEPHAAPASDDFRLVAAQVPERYAGRIAQVVRAERLREVVALYGFTRIDSPDSGVAEDIQNPHRAPLARQDPTWVPAAEVRGEGIFITLDEEALSAWEDLVGVDERGQVLQAAHERWRARRQLATGDGWRGHRYTLLHTLSHLLINELAMECGYSAASIRERIYSSEGGPGESMAGILLYTAAPDSEGTLGGLVSLARTGTFERILDQALRRALLCAADPMCAEHVPHETEDSLHAAACHACLFIPETSCERGNRYLDRAFAVPTLAQGHLAFFAGLVA